MSEFAGLSLQEPQGMQHQTHDQVRLKSIDAFNGVADPQKPDTTRGKAAQDF